MVLTLSPKVKQDFLIAGGILSGFSLFNSGVIGGFAQSTGGNGNKDFPIGNGIILTITSMIDVNYINNHTNPNTKVPDSSFKNILIIDKTINIITSLSGITLLTLGLVADNKQ